MRIPRWSLVAVLAVTITSQTIRYSGARETFYPDPPAGSPVGEISGSVAPPTTECSVFADLRGGVYGGVARCDANGQFTIKSLLPGIYDLAVRPATSDTLALVGVWIPDGYGGDLSDDNDRAIRKAVARLPGAFRLAYLGKRLLRGIDDSVAPGFTDNIAKAKHVGIVSRLSGSEITSGTLLDYVQERNLKLLVGNDKKAAAICLVREDVVVPWYYLATRDPSTGKIVRTRIDEKKTYTSRFPDLCLFEKRGGIWQFVQREPVRPRLYFFRLRSGFVETPPITFVSSGQLVGVRVAAGQETNVGTVNLEKAKQ